MSSSAYRPPGSKSSSTPANTSLSSHQRNRFISSRPIVEKPPDTSCESLFPELVTIPSESISNDIHVKTATSVWGAVPTVSVTPTTPPPPIPSPLPPPTTKPIHSTTMFTKHSKRNTPSRPQRVPFNFDNHYATQLMHDRKIEEEELNALSGYRNDYVYLHELDDCAYSDDDSDGGSG